MYLDAQVRPVAGLLLVPYLMGNLVAALLLTTSGLAQETTPPTPEELKGPAVPPVRSATVISSTSVSLSNGSGPGGSRQAAATEGGNGAKPMGAAVLGTDDASVSGNGADFRRQNGSGGNGLSYGPVRLPVGRDVSAGAVSALQKIQPHCSGWSRRHVVGPLLGPGPACAGPCGKLQLGMGLQRVGLPLLKAGARKAHQARAVRGVHSCRAGVSRSLLNIK